MTDYKKLYFRKFIFNCLESKSIISSRGQYLLMMKCYDLAKFTIYQVAEMDKGKYN